MRLSPGDGGGDNDMIVSPNVIVNVVIGVAAAVAVLLEAMKCKQEE